MFLAGFFLAQVPIGSVFSGMAPKCERGEKVGGTPKYLPESAFAIVSLPVPNHSTSG